ncbi:MULTISPECIES: hypothetical protein [Bradyrhizobium]|uniref:Transposase n=1 Tax=Bradyrhizobium denitrificans TaxID=2734912 RepID=A0ABS5GEB5_9BRAD|nr:MULTISPECIES: hypothetical protein [Bradyrhizobium]MBR1139525.1 hypothetical protein [Bradyrhizobium denitrificans]MDU0958743.1 hypothetical protein [Bradyrhizobium sp.]MDU1494665.1 hypothetical protein [Bradyrhizobium sp.]MDU1544787.1 hypothetical protein [Bradyrhizobium sp.]MDU1688256.1 hypothetical protein [Bradyrhizobium sp.]
MNHHATMTIEMKPNIDVLALQPRAQQRHIGDKGEQQPKGERELDPPAKDVEIGSHGLTIWRF